MTELDRRRFASVLTTDANFQAGACFPPALGGDLDQLSDSILVEDRKWILLEDAFFQIGRQHLVDVVARSRTWSESDRWCRMKRTGPL